MSVSPADKVSALIALAASADLHEASLAARTAHRLMGQYGLRIVAASGGRQPPLPASAPRTAPVRHAPTITVGYRAPCTACRRPVERGERAVWLRGVGVTHPGCWSPEGEAR